MTGGRGGTDGEPAERVPAGGAGDGEPADDSGGSPARRRRVAVFGGVYSNHLALEAALEDARERGADELHCLGDLGAFGPNPDNVFPLLVENGVEVVRGNYDDSIGRGLEDCQCGYTDPRDDHFAALSYRYTFRNTSEEWRGWLADLPDERRIGMAGREVLMCHGSPRRMNEFLWESTTSTQFLSHLAREHGADVILVTHTGIPWIRELPGGGLVVNVGALGRPANDGSTDVWYAMLTAPAPASAPVPQTGTAATSRAPESSTGGSPKPFASEPSGRTRGSSGPEIRAELIRVGYDHRRLAAEMREEDLPEEFVETILTGWWTTCLEVLPAKERARGRF